MPTSIGATKARRIFGQLLAKARYGNEQFIVEKGGEPMVALVGIEEYKALLERLEDLEDIRDMLERQSEPRRPFEEYLAERRRGEGV